jgi:hypothetical protein
MILVAGVLGLGWSEVIGLQVGDVDFLRRTLSVRRTLAEVEGVFHTADTKSRSSRRTMELYAHVPEEADRDVAAHLNAGWAGARHPADDVPERATGTIGHAAGTTTPKSPSADPSDGQNAWSEAVEVTGLEPATSTMRT